MSTPQISFIWTTYGGNDLELPELIKEERRISTEMKEELRKRAESYEVPNLVHGGRSPIQRISIEQLVNRRPVLSPRVADFNISHQYPGCVGVLVPSPFRVGIDITNKVLEVNFTESELGRLFHPIPNGSTVSLFWALREAYLKSHDEFDLDGPPVGIKVFGSTETFFDTPLSEAILEAEVNGVKAVVSMVGKQVCVITVRPNDPLLLQKLLVSKEHIAFSPA